MTETTANSMKAKTAKEMTDPFGMAKYEMPKMEVPAQFREMTDKGVAQARDAYAKAKVASDEAGGVLESAYAAVAKGAMQYNLRLISIARTNTRAAFDCANELLGVKSPSEFVELSTAHLRKQLEIVSVQNKELYALAQEVATKTAEPIKAGMAGMAKEINKAT
jgi:phasin